MAPEFLAYFAPPQQPWMGKSFQLTLLVNYSVCFLMEYSTSCHNLQSRAFNLVNFSWHKFRYTCNKYMVMYIYIINTGWIFKPWHCVSWFSTNRQMATDYYQDKLGYLTHRQAFTLTLWHSLVVFFYAYKYWLSHFFCWWHYPWVSRFLSFHLSKDYIDRFHAC